MFATGSELSQCNPIHCPTIQCLLFHFSFLFLFLLLNRCSDGLRARRPRLDSQQCYIFLFSTTSRPKLEPTQPLILWVPGLFYPGTKRQVCEADKLLTSSFEVKKGEAILPLPPICLHGIGKRTPWLLVRKRTLPTERPPLVGEVSANFCG
jgi:hypothetical protein